MVLVFVLCMLIWFELEEKLNRIFNGGGGGWGVNFGDFVEGFLVIVSFVVNLWFVKWVVRGIVFGGLDCGSVGNIGKW